MKAKEFMGLKGFWNGKIYHGNEVYKDNHKYVIDDPENLPQKKHKTSFRDVLSKLSDARISIIVYLRDNKQFSNLYHPLEDDEKDWAITKLNEEIAFLKEEVKRLKKEVTDGKQ